MATPRRHRPGAPRWAGVGLAVALAGVGLAPAAQAAVTDDSTTPIASLKEVYSDYFDVGNIYSSPATYAAGSPNSAVVERHFNIMTAENYMKPDQLLPNDNINPETGEWTYNFGPADAFVDQTLARGMKVHGHVLVWHGQSPPNLNRGLTRDEARANMERYIEDVLTHFSGRVVSWDVVNEAFVDGLAEFDPATQDWRDFLRGGPNGGFSDWYNAYANGDDPAAGESPADFIYDAFVFARTYGPETRLEYNDFNVFQSEGKAQAIIAMATDLNARYAAEHPEDPRPLVEVIGMQSHNYINQTPAFACSDLTRLPELVDDDAEEWQPGACSNEASVERSLQLITEAGFKANISELDLQVWEAWNGQPEGDDRSLYRDLNDPTVADRISRGEFDYWVGKINNRAELEAIQAQRFAEYFAVYKKYSQNIHRVTFWGLNDALSWRATHNPLLFNSDWSQKLGAVAVADPEGWLGLRQPDPFEDYIDAVYQDLLGRGVDAVGMVGWSTALRNGTPRVAVANGITASDEFRAKLIAESYRSILEREPDAVGARGWLRAMHGGITIQQLEAGIFASREYMEAVSEDDFGWIENLYATVLGREAAEAEVEFWASVIAEGGVSHAAVAHAILNSEEALTPRVDSYYQDLLGRGIDPTGARHWVSAIQAGSRLEQIIGGIIASDEYYDL